MEFDDLVQAGFVGLLKANLKYDKSRNVKFLTYAEYRIVGEMFDEVRKFQKLSRTYFNQKKNLNNAYKTLYMSLNCKPDSEKVAEYLNISLDEYYSMVFYTNLSIISIDDDTSYWISNISSNDFNPEEYIIYFDSITSVKDTVFSAGSQYILGNSRNLTTSYNFIDLKKKLSYVGFCVFEIVISQN